MDHTGCHQLNRVLTHNNTVSKKCQHYAEEPRVLLYRDSAAWCPYCQKIWMQLEVGLALFTHATFAVETRFN
jgi:hypothetical protein